jgi:hypothetical protein
MFAAELSLVQTVQEELSRFCIHAVQIMFALGTVAFAVVSHRFFLWFLRKTRRLEDPTEVPNSARR